MRALVSMTVEVGVLERFDELCEERGLSRGSMLGVLLGGVLVDDYESRPRKAVGVKKVPVEVKVAPVRVKREEVLNSVKKEVGGLDERLLEIAGRISRGESNGTELSAFKGELNLLGFEWDRDKREIGKTVNGVWRVEWRYEG